MAWVATDKNGEEYLYEEKPSRDYGCIWKATFREDQDRNSDFIELPKGSIKKLIGRELSWDDETVELKKIQL